MFVLLTQKEAENLDFLDDTLKFSRVCAVSQTRVEAGIL